MGGYYPLSNARPAKTGNLGGQAARAALSRTSKPKRQNEQNHRPPWSGAPCARWSQCLEDPTNL